MKKMLLILSLFFTLLILTSCRTYNSLIPNLASWEGNYIYYANKCSKTTGDEETTLFDTVEYLGITYNITDISNHSYINDRLYFACSLRENLKVYDQDCSAICKYNLKTKELNVLYFLYNEDLDDVNKWYYNNKYLIAGTNNHIVRISLIDDTADSITGTKKTTIYNNQIYFIKDKKLYYCNIDDLKIIQISSCEGIYRYHLTKINDVNVVLIFAVNSNNDFEIYVYEWDKNITYSIYTGEDNSSIIDVEGKYLIVGEDEAINTQYPYSDTQNNNTIYSYKYDNDKVILNKIYQFPDYIHISSSKIALHNFIEIDAYNSKTKTESEYILDIDRKTFIEVGDASKLFNKGVTPKTEYICGEYTYYTSTRNDTEILYSFNTIYLERMDSRGNVVTMQFYSDHEDHNERKYPSSSFIYKLSYARIDQVIITNGKY